MGDGIDSVADEDSLRLDGQGLCMFTEEHLSVEDSADPSDVHRVFCAEAFCGDKLPETHSLLLSLEASYTLPVSVRLQWRTRFLGGGIGCCDAQVEPRR